MPARRGWCGASLTMAMLVALLFLVSVAARAAERVDLLVTGATVVTMDSSRQVIDNGAIAVAGERIVGVGRATELASRYSAKRKIDARDKIVLPGLVNAHNHAPMVLFRGIADDLALMDWLQKYIFPAESRTVSPDFVDWGTALACLEMIRSGTTTYSDMYYFEDRVAAMTARAGMRAVLGETVIQFPVADNRTPEEALAYTESFMQRWKGHALIVPAVAPHAPYTNSAVTLRAAKALADKYSLPMMVHVSETQDEGKQIREKYGMTPTQWLDSLGVLGPNVTFHHGVWLSDDDLTIVRRRGVSVSHNPESNMKLASGIAPVPKMLALGIPVGLGTDGAASNNNLDMFQAMDFAAKLHKLALMDPTALPAEHVVEMATIGGARSLGLQKETGSLEPGKRADFIAVDAKGAHALPRYNVYSHLVYALKGSDVSTSVINGKVVMLDGRVLTLDEAAIKAKAREYQARILASIK